MIDENVEIGDGATVGDEKSGKSKIALVGRGNKIAAGAKVAAGEIVD